MVNGRMRAMQTRILQTNKSYDSKEMGFTRGRYIANRSFFCCALSVLSFPES